jgi:hypothetical protein
MIASTRLRQLTLMGIPFAFAILLLFHPLALGHALGEESIYEALRNHVLRWQVVHVLQLLFIGLMGVAIYVLTSTMEGSATTVSRLAAVSFVLFYGAWEAATGIGTGVLVSYANSLPAAEQAVANDIVQAYFDNPLIGNRSLLSVLGMLSWFAALGAAAISFLLAGAPRSVPVLLALSGLAFGLGHPPPLGPLGLVFFIAATWRLERGPSHVSAQQVE